jgi:hypothetical protein
VSEYVLRIPLWSPILIKGISSLQVPLCMITEKQSDGNDRVDPYILKPTDVIIFVDRSDWS